MPENFASLIHFEEIMSEKKMTAIAAALARLTEAQRPGQAPVYLAVHELGFDGHSQNALATRLSEAARLGLVAGRYRAGKKFKEWGPALGIAPELPLAAA